MEVGGLLQSTVSLFQNGLSSLLGSEKSSSTASDEVNSPSQRSPQKLERHQSANQVFSIPDLGAPLQSTPQSMTRGRQVSFQKGNGTPPDEPGSENRMRLEMEKLRKQLKEKDDELGKLKEGATVRKDWKARARGGLVWRVQALRSGGRNKSSGPDQHGAERIIEQRGVAR